MKKLIYFADPMCSWCYAFNKVLARVMEKYPELEIELIAGGYSPGNTEFITEEFKDFLRSTWETINKTTGTKFNYDLSFADDYFCYDTEPPSRALKVIQNYDKELEFEFLKMMHEAFYIDNLNITEESVLTDLAERMGINRRLFIDAFNSEVMKMETIGDFNKSRNMGINGFPALIGQSGNNFRSITYGYQSSKVIIERIELWLNEIDQGI